MNTYDYRGITIDTSDTTVEDKESITITLDNTNPVQTSINFPNTVSYYPHTIKYTQEGFKCPDCPDTVLSCKDCLRYTSRYPQNVPVIPNPYMPTVPFDQTVKFTDIPAGCVHCPNHPSNGGSGICHCTIGTMPVIC